MSIIAKILPNSLEAEQAVLASIMLDEEVPLIAFSTLKSSDFYSLNHKTIFEVMVDIYKNTQPVDFVTVVDKLESQNKLGEVGGIEYITTLTNLFPNISNSKHYINIVKNHSCRRKIISACQKIIDYTYENEDSSADLSFAEKQIFDISENEQFSSLEHIEKSLKSIIEKFDFIAENHGQIQGLSTGLKDLDAITNGLQNSDLILIAARPGFGKTSLAMNIVQTVAIEQGKTCAVFSFEMPTEQIAQRAICSVGCVSMSKARRGTLNEEDWQSVWIANKKLSESKIFIDNSSLNTPTDILSKCRKLKLEHGLDLIMIDYLQLMKSGSGQQNRVLEIGEITRALKITAKELNVPIILLSQLSRSVDSRTDHRPILADLRDSGAIEQDADIVMFIYNPDKYNDVVQEDKEHGIVELEIAKHRNGELGTVKLKWVGEWVKFINKNDKTPTYLEKTKTEDKEMANSKEIKEMFENKVEYEKMFKPASKSKNIQTSKTNSNDDGSHFEENNIEE